MSSSKKNKTSDDHNKPRSSRSHVERKSPSGDLYSFYRVYSKDATQVKVNHLCDPSDPYLGRFTAKDIGPPHLALNVRRFLCKLEKIPTTTSTELYEEIYSQKPYGDGDRVDLSRAGYKPSKALIVTISGDVKKTGTPDPEVRVPAPVPETPAPAPPPPAPTPRAPSPVRPPPSFCGYTYYITSKYSAEIGIELFGTALTCASYLQKGPSQQWTVEDAGNGEVYLKNGRGRYLNVIDEDSRGLAACLPQGTKWKLQWDGIHTKIIYSKTNLPLYLSATKDMHIPTPHSPYYGVLTTMRREDSPDTTVRQLWSFSRV